METEIAKPVIAWLERQHWDVYQEVQRSYGGPRADIVALRGRLVWVLEVKATLGLAVMQQASAWPVHFRSIVVPEPKQRPFRARETPERAFAARLCEQVLGVGLITVNLHPANDWVEPVHVALPPPLQRRFDGYAREFAAACRPEHKTHAVAGSTRGGHYTPYRGTMNGVQNLLRLAPNGMTIRQIFEAFGRGHYHSDATAKSQIGHCLESYEADWCFVDKTVKPWRYRLRRPEDPSPSKPGPREVVMDPFATLYPTEERHG